MLFKSKKDALAKATQIADEALSLFHRAKAGLEAANAHLSAIKDEADAAIRAAEIRYDAAHDAHFTNNKVIAKLTDLLGD